MAIKQPTVTLELSLTDARELAGFIEDNIFRTIRADVTIDNIYWLHRVVNIHERLTDGCVNAMRGDDNG